MKYPENIEAVQNCQPDFMGFIFYEKSLRYVEDNLLTPILNQDKNTQTIGVFVNSPIHEVIETVTTYKFDFVQLHGDESIQYTKELYNQNIKIIKAFQIQENFKWESISSYAPYVTYFLFDTATKNYGGSGKKFDWKQLNSYKEKTPFFLSGGITVNDIQDVKKLNIPQLFAIDINSKFEIEPGLKNVELIEKMINEIKNERIVSSK